jgi:nucleotide-binding universal stress UspA family protein
MKGTIERILVPTDGSTESEAVFPALMPIVRAYAPEVALLHVIEDPEASFMPPAPVAKACGALRASNVNAYLELREGMPAEEILRAAREKKADLIAMSTHGRSGLVRLIAGSVAEEVLRGAEVPVLVTRPGTSVRDWKRIVVALDGSERSEAILPDAVLLSRKLGMPVEVLRVAVPSIAPGAGEVAVMVAPEDPMPYLMTVIARLKSEGIDAHALALEGSVTEAILRHLGEAKGALLCMTTHGRSGIGRIMMGSIAEQLLRKAPSPLLLRRSLPAPKPAAKAPTRKTVKAR